MTNLQSSSNLWLDQQVSDDNIPAIYLHACKAQTSVIENLLNLPDLSFFDFIWLTRDSFLHSVPHCAPVERRLWSQCSHVLRSRFPGFLTRIVGSNVYGHALLPLRSCLKRPIKTLMPLLDWIWKNRCWNEKLWRENQFSWRTSAWTNSHSPLYISLAN